MANKNDKNNIKDERIEDTTLYGEFIASFDQWMTPDRQREKSRFLAEVSREISAESSDRTKKDNKKSR